MIVVSQSRSTSLPPLAGLRLSRLTLTLLRLLARLSSLTGLRLAALSLARLTLTGLRLLPRLLLLPVPRLIPLRLTGLLPIRLLPRLSLARLLSGLSLTGLLTVRWSLTWL